MGIIPARQRPTPARIRLLQFILLILVGIISYGALVLPLAFSPASVPLQAGDVSPSDYQAPQSLQYTSEVRTKDARLVAENSVAPVSASPAPTITPPQLTPPPPSLH